MFYDCTKLEYINLKNFKDNNSLTVTDIFHNVPDNVTLYLNTNCNKILQELNKKYICCFNIIDHNYYQILNKEECLKNYKIKNIAENSEKNEITKEDIKYYDTILDYMEDILTSEDYNISNIDNGNDEKYEIGKLKITFSTTQNQKKI